MRNGFRLYWFTVLVYRLGGEMIGRPTEFAGSLMRSELEATWALSWHRAGVEWVYEPVKVWLGGVSSYTPDFVLPTFGVLIQVKPGWPNGEAIERACAAARRLCSPIYFLCGPPGRCLVLRTLNKVAGVEVLGAPPFPTKETPAGGNVPVRQCVTPTPMRV